MNKNSNRKKEMIRDSLVFVGLLLVAVILLIIFPEKKQDMIHNSKDFLVEMIFILPAVMILMGLFEVWVPKESIVKYLGNTSGWKGILLSFILGALPTGPLYVAFPMAGTLAKKGASITNIVIFLSAWGCIKIPQELVEIQFLGLEFMMVRLVSTVILVTIMALIINKFYNNTGGKQNESI